MSDTPTVLSFPPPPAAPPGRLADLVARVLKTDPAAVGRAARAAAAVAALPPPVRRVIRLCAEIRLVELEHPGAVAAAGDALAALGELDGATAELAAVACDWPTSSLRVPPPPPPPDPVAAAAAGAAWLAELESAEGGAP